MNSLLLSLALLAGGGPDATVVYTQPTAGVGPFTAYDTATFQGSATSVYGRFSVLTSAAPGAPTAALVATDTGNLTNGAYTYKVSCVNATGETEAGTASNSVTVDGDGPGGITDHKQVTLSAIPTCSTGATARKLYRTASGGATYKLLATISDVTTTTYADNIADASLGANAPSTNSTAYLRLPNFSDTTLPATCSAGDVAYSTTTPNVQFCNGSNTWGPMIGNVTPQTVADDGAGTHAAFNIAATGGVTLITCNDADQCDGTLLETSAVSGSFLTLVNMGTNVVNLADTSGVSETTGAIALGQYDSARYVYASDRWVLLSSSNN